jgi:hypothetical protein
VKSTGAVSSCLLVQALSSDPSRKLDILGEESHSFGVDCALIGILEKASQEAFSCLLKSNQALVGKPDLRIAAPCDLLDKSLERESCDEETRFLLELLYLS